MFLMVRKYESTNIRKKQLANAAVRVIIKYGSEHITIKKIAKEVGISETAIYRHFKSKGELLAFLIDDIETTLLSDIELNTTGNPYTLETLERTIKKHIEKVAQRKGISFQIVAEIVSLGSKKLNKQVYGVINMYIGRIKDILEKGRKAGIVRQDIDLDAAATIFFGITQGLVNTWTLSQYKFNLEEKYLLTWSIFRNSILIK
jgi:TetR/AcrR family transcriptional regulator, fatty acid metabolism regulator protein